MSTSKKSEQAKSPAQGRLAAPLIRRVCLLLIPFLGALSVVAQDKIAEISFDLGSWVITDNSYFRKFDLPANIPPQNITSITTIIRDDNGTLQSVSAMPDTRYQAVSSGHSAVSFNINSGKWEIEVSAGGIFSNVPANYDDPNISRGAVTVRYVTSPQTQAMLQDNSLFFRIGTLSMNSGFVSTRAIPGLPVATSSVQDFQATIYSNPVNGKIEVDKVLRPSGYIETSDHYYQRRDRGGRERLMNNKAIELGYFNPLWLPPQSPISSNYDPSLGRFSFTPWSGYTSNRGWVMVKYAGGTGTSTLSQPYAIQTKIFSTGSWDAYDATGPFGMALDPLGVTADRIVYFNALAISDPVQGYRYYSDFHQRPNSGGAVNTVYPEYVLPSGGGGVVTLSETDNRIYFYPNHYGMASSSAYSQLTGSRALATIYYRAADCADGVGTVLTSSANVGARSVSADVWNGSGYATNAAYQGCNGYRNNLYVIENTGDNIWTNGSLFDAFRFVYKGGSGQRTMTVKVEQLENTNSWARAGIMLREGTANNGRYAGVFVTPGNGLIFQGRAQNGRG